MREFYNVTSEDVRVREDGSVLSLNIKDMPTTPEPGVFPWLA